MGDGSDRRRHVLAANLVEGADGKWSAFAHPDLYRHGRAAGEVFQAVFREELTASLGVEWRPGRHVPEIAGIPQAILDLFSKRSTEVDAWLTATGTADTREGRQAAVLATRRHKPEVEDGRFDEAWKAEAQAAGWGPDAAERLAGWSLQRPGHTVEGCWRLDDVVFDEDGGAEHESAESCLAPAGECGGRATSGSTRRCDQRVAGRRERRRASG